MYTDENSERIEMSRRRAVQLLGIGGVSVLAGAPAIIGAKTRASERVEPCQLAVETIAGPYYIDPARIRRNIAEGRPGIPLLLRTLVLNTKTCRPVPAAAVDIWQCDARGFYSGYTGMDPDLDLFGLAQNPNPDPATIFARTHRTDNLTFLRGAQISDNRGNATFQTIYPGWYFHRAVHIHARVHIGGSMKDGHYSGGHICHTGQLGFPEVTTARVGLTSDYNNRNLIRTTYEEDVQFSTDKAETGLVKLTQRGRDIGDGFIGDIVLGVNPDAAPDGAPMPIIKIAPSKT